LCIEETVSCDFFSKVARLVAIPTPSVAQGSFSSQALGKTLEWYQYIDSSNNTVCAFVKASADIPSSERDLKGPEAGYILLTSASTSEIGKDVLIASQEIGEGTGIRAISWTLRGACSIWTCNSRQSG
jgi:hypothetical protein